MIWFALAAVALGAFAVGWVVGIAYGAQQEQRRIEAWLLQRIRKEAMNGR